MDVHAERVAEELETHVERLRRQQTPLPRIDVVYWDDSTASFDVSRGWRIDNRFLSIRMDTDRRYVPLAAMKHFTLYL